MQTFNIQPQLAQLECKFNGPLVRDSQVETVDRLITFNPKFNYLHKIVWVISEKCNYILSAGDGTSLLNWERVSNRATITAYRSENEYGSGEICYQNGLLYAAKKSVPTNIFPSANIGTYWELLSTEAISTRILFSGVSNFIFETTIKNPIFVVYVGIIMKDDSGNSVYDSNGFRKFSNVQEVVATIIPRGDITESAYELQFHIDGMLAVPENSDGYILVK